MEVGHVKWLALQGLLVCVVMQRVFFARNVTRNKERNRKGSSAYGMSFKHGLAGLLEALKRLTMQTAGWRH